MATRRQARRKPWNRARRRAVGWERLVCARRALVSLASRGDPTEKVSGAELGANPDLGEAGRLPGEKTQVLACPALAVSLEGRVGGGQGWGGSPSCSPKRQVLSTAPFAAGYLSFLRGRWHKLAG